MSSEAGVADAIGEMIDYFTPHCSDIKTLTELKAISADHKLWRKGHDLFGRIREKTRLAIQNRDSRLEHQYLFEEISAKTLYNLSGYPAPFDSDSAFWAIPIALQFAAHLQLDDPYSMTAVLLPK